MLKRTIVTACAILISGAGIAVAQDVITERQEAMKSVGSAMRVVGGMARGNVEFDAQAALTAFTTMNEVAGRYGSLFPEGSETGGDTKAKETIWSDREGFDAAVAKFEVDTAAAVAAAPATFDEFRPVFGSVAQNCGACHEVYQIEDD